MESTLKKYFGYSVFREYQKEIIEKIIDGRDCLVVMATGSGKSLCYQIPPLVLGKTAIIVSPLISLMQDQVMSLKQRGIKAEYLASTQTDPTVHNKAESGYFHILYMTPEKACSISLSFWSKLLESGVCLFAVDEAHCISEWGHDFRVEYKQLDKLRSILLEVPFVGLTATATEKVRFDIVNSLKMKDPYLTIGSFDRKNLFYGVKSFNRGLSFVDELVGEISKFVSNAGSTIIYCTTIKDVEQGIMILTKNRGTTILKNCAPCERFLYLRCAGDQILHFELIISQEIFKALQEVRIRAGIYHGQMAKHAREESHRLFVRDELHVMVATIAFGMGIDKPNVRYVIHYGCPKSLESYYQGSGRCGRDGIASECWLYYTRSDFAKADFYCGEAQTETQRRAILLSLMAAQRYCSVTSCRRKFLLDHFGQKFTSDRCDNCDNCTVSMKEVDMSREAYLLMACIQSCGGRWGLNMPVDVLRGSQSKKILDAKFDKLPLHGLGKDYFSNWWKDLGYQLISSGYLVETAVNTYRTISVGPKGLMFLRSSKPDQQPPLLLPKITETVHDKECKSETGRVGLFKSLDTLENEGCSKAEAELYYMLLEERMKLARVIGTAPYAICGDQTLKKIALTRPSTKARLANIDGVNQHLLTKHGDHLLHTIGDLSQRLNLSLDGDGDIQCQTPVTDKAATTRKLYTMPNPEKRLAPAKFDAWKMWHEGLSIKRIANLPGRPKPIKEQTVIEYLLDAAREGCAIDWTRLCDDVGLTREMSSNIHGAVLKAGSRDKLKPIKNELPEDISYEHIKVCLAMQDCTVPTEKSPPIHRDELPSMASELIPSAIGECPRKVETPVTDEVAFCCLDQNEKSASVSFTGPTATLPACDDYQLPASKRLKIDRAEEESSIILEATESSILEWLKNSDGVRLSDIVEHFDGSTEEHVMNLLSCLEGDFLIFKKNSVYNIM